MKTCTCSESECLTNGRFSVAFLDQGEKAKQLHNHNYLEIYLSISGGKRFIIDDAIYPMCDNDVFVINQFQPHLPEAENGETLRRYVFSIMPQFLASISSPSTNLLNLFYSTDKYPSRIPLSDAQKEQLIRIIHKLGNIIPGYGIDLLENSLLIEALLLLLNISRQTGSVVVTDNKYVSDILNYINQSLDKDLSLDTLSAKFFLSKGYFCRLFKEHTGVTVNKYVLAKRIASAKQPLSAGCSVQEAAARTGFNDYASFIRRFKEDVGVSPKRYGRGSGIHFYYDRNSD